MAFRLKHLLGGCRKRSVFSDAELKKHWDHKRYNRPFVVNFLFLYSLPKRPNLKALKEHNVIGAAPRGFEPLSDQSFRRLLEVSHADTRFIVKLSLASQRRFWPERKRSSFAAHYFAGRTSTRWYSMLRARSVGCGEFTLGEVLMLGAGGPLAVYSRRWRDRPAILRSVFRRTVRGLRLGGKARSPVPAPLCLART